MTRPKGRDERVTEPGVWDASPSESALLIKAHALWLADPEAALADFRAHARHHAARLAAYEASLAALDRGQGTVPLALADAHRLGEYLALSRRVGYEREYLGWIRQVIALLEERAHAGQPG